MYFELCPSQQPSLFTSYPRRREPVRQYHQLRQEMDDLLAPAMYVLQHMSHPRVVTPKTSENKDNQYVVKMDVQQFTPEELSVKMVNKFVVIEGKHEEKQDDHGFISRHFVRRYAIPEDVKEENITCNLSSDGVLVISAPRNVEEPKRNERSLPINFTGQPAVIEKAEKTSGGDEADKEKEVKEPTAA